MLPSSRLVLMLTLLGVALAQAPAYTVYVSPFPPFSQPGGTGLDIDLWEAVAQRLKGMYPEFSFSYEDTTLADVYNDVSSNNQSFGVGALTITTATRARVDFSSSYMLSGLDVMVRQQERQYSFLQFYNPLSLEVWFVLSILVFFSGHVIWFLESSYQPRVFPGNYFLGVNEGIWFIWGTLTAANQKDLIGFASRMYSVGWSTLTILLVATYTATFAASLTASRLDTGLDSVSKLGGMDVGSVRFSPGASYMQSYMPNTRHFLYDDFDQCYRALLSGEIRAAVFDSSVLLVYKQRFDADKKRLEEQGGAAADLAYTGTNELNIMGAKLTTYRYGIACNYGNPYVEDINRILADFSEDGTLTALRQNYLGDNVDVSGSVDVPKKDTTVFQPLDLNSAVGIYFLILVSLIVAAVSWFLLQFGHLIF